MADRYYGLNFGQNRVDQVVEGSATGGASARVEIRISDQVYTEKLWVLQAIQVLEQYLNTREGRPIS